MVQGDGLPGSGCLIDFDRCCGKQVVEQVAQGFPLNAIWTLKHPDGFEQSDQTDDSRSSGTELLFDEPTGLGRGATLPLSSVDIDWLLI